MSNPERQRLQNRWDSAPRRSAKTEEHLLQRLKEISCSEPTQVPGGACALQNAGMTSAKGLVVSAALPARCFPWTSAG